MRRALMLLALVGFVCMGLPVGSGAAGAGSATAKPEAAPVPDPFPPYFSLSKNSRILTDNPENVGAVLELGRVYENLSQYRRAVDLYEAALVTLPDNTVLHLRVAAVYRWMDDFPAASRHYDAVLALQPDNNEALLGRAYVGAAHADAEPPVARAPVKPFPSSAPVSVRHRVVAGDTLGAIAAEYLGAAARWPEVWRANPELADPDRLAVGQVLQVPVAVHPGTVLAAAMAAAPVAPAAITVPAAASSPVSAPEHREGPGGLHYVVRTGDTLGAIAARYLGDAALWRTVWEASGGIEDPDVIYAGQVLTLPIAADAPAIFVRYTVKSGDTLGQLAATYLGGADQWEMLWKTNRHLKDPDRIIPGDELMMPVTRVAQAEPQPATLPGAGTATVRHVVAEGDTLRGIAHAYLGDASRWKAVWMANPAITNPLELPTGQVIVVPVQGKEPSGTSGRPEKSAAIRHTVQPGDTLYTIAQTYLGDSSRWKTIWAVNPGLANPLQLTPGQLVDVPRADPYEPPVPAVRPAEKTAPLPRQTALIQHMVREGDTLGTIAGRHLGDPDLWMEIWRANSTLASPDLIVPGQVLKIPSPTPAPRRVPGHPL